MSIEEESSLRDLIQRHLKEICLNIGERPTGSRNNWLTAEYIAKCLSDCGFSVEKQEFPCLDWESGHVFCQVGGVDVKVFISPYSLPLRAVAPFTRAGTIEELASEKFQGKIALLTGDLCSEQLMPKNFPFYNPPKHQEIIRLLEEKNPVAIVSITARDAKGAGSLYPSPLIEDGDFHIPAVYMSEEEGKKFLNRSSSYVNLQFASQRIDARGFNVIGKKSGDTSRRIVFCAHLDSKRGTPGALDNGSGISVLLALAYLLKDYQGSIGIEIAALNGEDYYGASGQILYLEEKQRELKDIILALNFDGVGYRDKSTAFSLYGVDEEISGLIIDVFFREFDFIKGEGWQQGDHMLFVNNGVPAVAKTSENMEEIMENIVHTEKDRIYLISTDELCRIAQACEELLEQLNRLVERK